MCRKMRNRESYYRMKQRAADCDLPQIPEDCHLAMVNKGCLTDEQEARTDLAIKSACAAIHVRRGDELRKQSGERTEAYIREFTTLQGIVRAC